MPRFAPLVLRRYLLGGRLPTTTACLYRQRRSATQLHGNSSGTESADSAPFRKRLKDEAKNLKAAGGRKKQDNQTLEKWKLTVGIEIHAQLNTASKLFSSAASTINDEPNSHVALFDVAMPGSQPTFQKETLIPALRAALALNCDIQMTSKFDRKHYFHWDQPSGYQITQYYEPFAKDGYITLYTHDGIAKEDGDQIRIGIKQVQMEQDTAKTISQPGDVHLLDFNRVGIPLIEIITLPQIHHPSTAAALVRKIQILLNAVDACVLGMQSGGLRADVNVSVRMRDGQDNHTYAGINGLGQRTEIKNLSSFKAVEDAIVAERDRQIEVLENGGKVEGETRGWTIGSTETRRLRGKEGEVDYRYMPDADLAPVIIGQDLLDHLKSNLGVLPDQELDILVDKYGLTMKDAMSLVSLDDGGRVEYFYHVVDEFIKLSGQTPNTTGKLCGNWVLHELGGLSHKSQDESNPLRMTPEGACIISASQLAQLLYYLSSREITGRSAKKALSQLFSNSISGISESITEIIEREGWWFESLSEEEYEALAKKMVGGNQKVVDEILAGKEGKLKFLLGSMIRSDTEGRLDPLVAGDVLRMVVDELRFARGKKN